MIICPHPQGYSHAPSWRLYREGALASQELRAFVEKGDTTGLDRSSIVLHSTVLCPSMSYTVLLCTILFYSALYRREILVGKVIRVTPGH